MKIAIQGNKGSYSEIASMSLYGEDIEVISKNTFLEVFKSLDSGECDFCVIPIENSTYGSVYQNFDLLTKFNFNIVKEIYLEVNFHVIALNDVKFEDITEIYTHPVGMAQISGFLEANPQIKPIEYHDTAGSLEMIKAKNLTTSAGAASSKAAEMNGMQILKRSIQDNPKNYTRFFALSRKPEYAKTSNKTTLQFRLGKESGSLFEAIKVFATKNIPLVKIESRPVINSDWEYTFYIDVLEGIHTDQMKDCIIELVTNVRELRVLGSYVEGKYIKT